MEAKLDAQKFLDILNNEILGKRRKFIFYISNKGHSLYEYRHLLNLDRLINTINYELDKVYLASLLDKMKDYPKSYMTDLFGMIQQLSKFYKILFFNEEKNEDVLSCLAEYMNIGVDFINLMEKHTSELSVENFGKEIYDNYSYHKHYYN